jgi:hypothetical protein
LVAEAVLKSRFACSGPLVSWLAALIVLVLAAAPNPARAWGTQGHQVVANLAKTQLSAKAKLEVDRLLALEPGETLASISTWADEHRSPATAAWHYVNFPKNSCTYSAKRDCRDGQCVVAAIDRQRDILASTATDESRLRALKYLVHLVADIHQPLHAGYGEDRGGNSYQLQAFMRGTNLHAFWDVGLIRALDQDIEVMTARLQATGDKATGSGNDLGDPAKARSQAAQKLSGTLPSVAVQAAEESCRIVGQPGFYPERLVDMAYVQRFAPLMEQRLRLAGSRLAELINQALR